MVSRSCWRNPLADRLGVLLTAIGLLVGLGGCVEPTGHDEVNHSIVLVPGELVRASLSPPEALRYSVFLQADQAFHVDVVQQGLDLRVSVLGPRGQRILSVDGPNGARDVEGLRIVAEESGSHEIEIRAGSGLGTFELRIVSLQRASQEDRWEFAAARSLFQGDLLRISGRAQEGLAAEAYYRRAISLWRRLRAPFQEAIGWVRLGQLAGARGDREQQISSFEVALSLLTPQAPSGQKSYAYLNLGTARQDTSSPQAALAAFKEALRFAQEAGDRVLEATALNNMALLYERAGALEQAVEHFAEASDWYGKTGHEDWRALAMVNQASSLVLLGRLKEAREALVELENLYDRRGNEVGRVDALLELGWIAYLQKDWLRARQYYDVALEVSRKCKYRIGEAGVLDRRGTLFRALEQTDKAQEDFEAALAILRSVGDPLSVAHTKANLGWLFLGTGATKSAAVLQQAALAQFQASADRHGEAAALYLGARIARKDGDLGAALEQMNELLETVESQRMGVEQERSRITYLDLRFEYYEYYIDLLMALAAEQPGKGYLVAALDVVERGRSLSLLDQLETSGVSRRPPGPLPSSRIQEELLEDGTVLLVYSLGRDRSFVWALTPSTIFAQPLPGTEEIERLAMGLYRSLSVDPSSESRMQGLLAARALSEAILAPLGRRLDSAKRVIIQGDGALHLVPFGLLPLPYDDERLLGDHEVTLIPSASVISALRNQDREVARGVAVLADPPFTVADPRISSLGADPIAAAGFVDLQRLPHTSREAERVLSWVGIDEPTVKALGLSAQRDLITGGDLDSFRILHLATHGILHTDRPELSGVVLSMFAWDGTPFDGTLRVRDIVDLNLNAELVVLSGCRTALGERFRGEGVVGLSRAFMLAGVPRVVVSLWKVEDEATAELMGHFYQGMLEMGLSPAAAMNRAQVKMAASPRWENPHFWSAFVLQGEWRK